jgi:hypothetical protein
MDIVTSSLQLYLNAAASSSYPGTGTSWHDLSSNAYTASLVGSPTHFINRFNFSSGKYVDTNQSLSSDNFSVGVWFRASAAGVKMILSKETAAGWPWNYRIWLNGGTIIGDIAQSGGTSNSISSTLTNYNNNTWYHVMFTRDSSNMYLYVNGSLIKSGSNTLVGSITNSQELWFGLSAFTAGGANPNGSYQYVGDIGQTFIYNRVLSSSEILQTFEATRAHILPTSNSRLRLPQKVLLRLQPKATQRLLRRLLPQKVLLRLQPKQQHQRLLRRLPHESVTPTPTETATPTVTPTVTPTESVTPDSNRNSNTNGYSYQYSVYYSRTNTRGYS